MQVRKASLEEIKRISSQWKIFRKYNREADDTEVIGQGRDQAKLFSYRKLIEFVSQKIPNHYSIVIDFFENLQYVCDYSTCI